MEPALKSLAGKLRQFLMSDDGPAVVEYVVMLALIVIVSLTAIKMLGGCSSNTFNNVSQLTRTLTRGG